MDSRKYIARQEQFAPQPRTSSQRQGCCRLGQQDAHARKACGVFMTTRLGRAALGLIPARLPFYLEI